MLGYVVINMSDQLEDRTNERDQALRLNAEISERLEEQTSLTMCQARDLQKVITALFDYSVAQADYITALGSQSGTSDVAIKQDRFVEVTRDIGKVAVETAATCPEVGE